MLAMSPLFCPTLEWDCPLELGTIQAFDNFDFDSVFLDDNNNLSSSSSSQAQDHNQHKQGSNDDLVKDRIDSPQGTSSTVHHCDDNNKNPVLSKKLNHNASERDRRKKINNMYSSLRALLPGIDQRKKLSIPSTVGRVLEYIPELQKEVKKLNHKKEVLLTKISALEGNVEELIQDEKPKIGLIKESMPCSVSTNRLGDKEMVIQISTFERISIAEVLLMLEKNGYLVIDVSSFQSFGGTTFYNIHVWMEGNCAANLEMLNGALMLLLKTQKQIEVYY